MDNVTVYSQPNYKRILKKQKQRIDYKDCNPQCKNITNYYLSILGYGLSLNTAI